MLLNICRSAVLLKYRNTFVQRIARTSLNSRQVSKHRHLLQFDVVLDPGIVRLALKRPALQFHEIVQQFSLSLEHFLLRRHHLGEQRIVGDFGLVEVKFAATQRFEQFALVGKIRVAGLGVTHG